LRSNHALFAKQAASIDRLSEGRLVLGLAVGAREDDYTESNVDFHRRGAEFDALLARVTDLWRGAVPAVGPDPSTPDGPHLLHGGNAPAAFRRMAKHGRGWIAGGGGAGLFRAGAESAREAGAVAGREGSPRLLALGYFALGDHAREAADDYLHDFYAFLGPFGDQIAAGARVTPDAITGAVSEFTEAGCDELILCQCNPDPAQVELLADALGT
jgi:alkanesulfonate monooxygenase SsuD/methylene tetrahydromethanopterin reductase-like flavin-dependent oxidoreductase (luciferase family)